MTSADMLDTFGRSAVREGRASGGTVLAVKADTAERVLEKIADGRLALSDAAMRAAIDRFLHVQGTADRPVVQCELEVIIGLGF